MTVEPQLLWNMMAANSTLAVSQEGEKRRMGYVHVLPDIPDRI